MVVCMDVLLHFGLDFTIKIQNNLQPFFMFIIIFYIFPIIYYYLCIYEPVPVFIVLNDPIRNCIYVIDLLWCRAGQFNLI